MKQQYPLSEIRQHGLKSLNVVEWLDYAENNNFKDFEVDNHRTFDKGHGRIEKRKYYILLLN